MQSLTIEDLTRVVIGLVKEGFWIQSVMQKLGLDEEDRDLVEMIVEDPTNYKDGNHE
jgi:hypothetical protein